MKGHISSGPGDSIAVVSPVNPLEPVRWSTRRWVYSVATVFMVQLFLVVYLGENRPPTPISRQFQSKIMLAADPYSLQQLARSVPLPDPTAFALANVHGFSGDAWLKFRPLQYQAAGWSEPARWLNLDPGRLGETLFQAVATNVTPPLMLLEGATANASGWEIYLPPKAMPAQSELRVEVSDERTLLTRIDLPSWPHPDLLSNTVVQVLVDAEGFVLSTTPLNESGSREADQFATLSAAKARFSSIGPLDHRSYRQPAEGLTWARLIFQWHTLPPTVTNQPASLP